jgi:shikimate kinase
MDTVLASKNIILIGFMGSGKSTIGKLLSQELHYDFIDTDAMIETKEGLSIKEIFHTQGEAYFRQCEKNIFDNELSHLSNSIISTGGGFPIALDKLDTKGFVVFLDIPYHEISKRLSLSEKALRPLLSNNDEGEKLFSLREPIYQQKANFVVNATLPPNEVVKEILEHYSAF